MRFFLRSKIHKATVTDTDLNYEGSIGIDVSLMEKAGFLAGEKVLVADNSNGSRFETYVVKEEADSGKITIYGAASHLVEKGDEIIIMGFELADKEINPKVVLLGKGNSLIQNS